MTDKEKIAYLSHDGAFGILTRRALELKMSEASAFKLVRVYVLDLTDIHKLNVQVGYTEVNFKIASALMQIQYRCPEMLIGRIFSGDEIALIDPEDYCLPMSNIVPMFEHVGIGFRVAYTETYMGKSVKYYSKMFDEIINRLNKTKYYQAI